jgi:hypothetical protein
MEQRGRSYLLCSLFGVAAALLLSCGLLTLVRRPSLELSAARARWAARSFSHYRLELKYGALGYCRQSVEVEGDRVVEVLENTCSNAAPTVDQLFDQIERRIKTLHGACGPNGCECDGTIAVVAEYDARLGYPRAQSVRLDPLMRLPNPAYWKHRASGSYCSARDLVRGIITVVALKPIA